MITSFSFLISFNIIFLLSFDVYIIPYVTYRVIIVSGGYSMGKFQNILKELRTSHNLTQDGLAKKLKISRSTVGMYEKFNCHLFP